MTILALEFSSDHRSVALVRDGVVAARAGETGGRATRAFGLIETALRQARLEREAVDCVALGLGPGSYTGIRVAISIAQAWQLARGVKLLGLCTADCPAEQARTAGERGRLHILIDAQRNELYLATYELGDDAARPVVPLHLATRDDVQRRTAGEPTLGWDAAAGRFPGTRLLNPDAATLGRLASARSDFVQGEQLQPVYLRETNFVKALPARTKPVG